MLVSKLKPCAAALLVVALVGLGTAKVVQEAGIAQANPAAQKPDEVTPPGAFLRWGPLGRPLFLLVSNSAVQAELKLSASQKKALATFLAEVVEPLRSWRD